MVWVKCTTSAECKPIRIAESSVMDGCEDHYIAQCQVLVFINCFLENWSFVLDGVLGGYDRGTGSGSEYSEGTADNLRWSCLIDHRSYLSTEFPPFLEILPSTYR
jgi:hypothetical protein